MNPLEKIVGTTTSKTYNCYKPPHVGNLQYRMKAFETLKRVAVEALSHWFVRQGSTKPHEDARRHIEIEFDRAMKET